MPPSKEVMNRTLDVIRSLNYYFNIYFTERGTIQLYDGLDDDNYFEIEVFKDYIKVFIISKHIRDAAITKILSGSHEIRDLKKIVKRFFKEEF